MVPIFMGSFWQYYQIVVHNLVFCLTPKGRYIPNVLVSFLKLVPVPSYKSLNFRAFWEENIPLVDERKTPLRIIFLSADNLKLKSKECYFTVLCQHSKRIILIWNTLGRNLRKKIMLRKILILLKECSYYSLSL